MKTLEIIFICVLVAWSVGATALAAGLWRRRMGQTARISRYAVRHADLTVTNADLCERITELSDQLAAHRTASNELANLWRTAHMRVEMPEGLGERAILLARELNARRLQTGAREAEHARIMARHADLVVDLAERDRRIGQLAAELDAAREAGWRGPSTPASAEVIAQAFHEAYERLAPSFGYETRKASAVPWERVPESNRALMVAVATEVASLLDPRVPDASWTEQGR